MLRLQIIWEIQFLPQERRDCCSGWEVNLKQNFPGQTRNPWCTSCGLFPETQSHLLQCPEIVPKLGYLHGKTSKLNENLIYGNINQQQMIVKIFSDILEVRENLQKVQSWSLKIYPLYLWGPIAPGSLCPDQPWSSPVDWCCSNSNSISMLLDAYWI